MLGEYCRNYRVSKGATLKDIEGSDKVKTLSAFEMGRSSNIAHLLKYVAYSKQQGDFEKFIVGLSEHFEGANHGS